MSYNFMAALSFLVRNFALPNPFECFGAAKAVIMNVIAEPCIHVLAFATVGTMYRKGSDPALGSFLYLVIYAMITGILFLCSIHNFETWWIALVSAGIVAVVGGCSFLWNKLNEC